MELKVIKTDSQYHSLLQEAERLVSLDPECGSAEAERLELLSLLIEDFEKKNYFFDLPDPIDAIQFRMEEQGLRQVDLAPLVGGSRSRVSEILSRKRPLTVDMIRSISAGLGIPYEVLLSVQNTDKNSKKFITTEEKEEWDKFPIKEMIRRGWISFDNSSNIKSVIEETTENILKKYLTQVYENDLIPAYFRRTFSGNASPDEKSYYSTLAWTARVLQRSKQLTNISKKYDPADLNDEFFKEIAQLSRLIDGPKIVIDILAKKGIALIIEPKLPKTLLDGAAMLSKNGMPVIGMTLRYDRIDYFWFTLLHELAHIWKHINSSNETFIDRIENTSNTSIKEKEADRIARNALIPRSIWKKSKAYLNPSTESIIKLANQLSIHPAIIVGRLQKDYENYSMFREMLGQNSVHLLFHELTFA